MTTQIKVNRRKRQAQHIPSILVYDVESKTYIENSILNEEELVSDE